MIIAHILTFLVFCYLLPVLLYLFVLAMAGRFGKLRRYSAHPDKARIAIIIPSYKEDAVIVETARQALTQQYPADRYSITVVADQLQPATLVQLNALPINVIDVKLQKSMKARSLHAAFLQLDSGNYDLALILDADNIMSPDVLQKVNHAYQSGWQAIQCHRTAKNKNNSVAILDAMSEEVNNTMLRKGQRVLGLSCALIGSGMAFSYQLISDIFALPQIQDNPGEDREIDIQLVKKAIVVEFIEDAYVYDEKVQRREVYQKQRTRWLGTQVDHLKSFLSPDMKPLRTQRSYLILILSAANFIFGLQILLPTSPYWLGLIALYAVTLIISVPSSFYNRQTIIALLKVPALMFAMVRALLGIKKHKTGFLHTPKEFSN
jgi:cellulose synthase/poly-beta-1,6-N-acetylglucosamine synthase-like glycosyltransferase